MSSLLIISLIAGFVIISVVVLLGTSWYLARGSTTNQQSSQTQGFSKQEISIKCSKCGALMEIGFIPEFSYPQGIILNSWIKGKPEYGVWSGGPKIRRKEMLPVLSYRCSACGYLESYAVGK